MPVHPHHDVIVIGASMGGIESLKILLSTLPLNIPAAVFIVLHMSRDFPSRVGGFVGDSSSLPVRFAKSDEVWRPGNVYLAVPDFHLLLRGDHMVLAQGPRENFTRPAVDPLFRSAAADFTTRVIGVVLTGLLDDGSSGLAAIKRCGGICVVQDPDDALYPDMPRNAMNALSRLGGVDHAVRLEEMGPLLASLAAVPPGKPVEVPPDIVQEVGIAAMTPKEIRIKPEHWKPSLYTCPDCGGVLLQADNQEIMRFRCHIGHAHTAKTLADAQSREVEDAVALALRTLLDREKLLGALAHEEEHQSVFPDSILQGRLAETSRHVASLRNLLASIQQQTHENGRGTESGQNELAG